MTTNAKKDKTSTRKEVTGTRAVAENHQFSIPALTQYLAKHVAGFPTNCEIKVLQFSHGQSNPTFYIEAGKSRYVMRKKPPGKLLPSAHAIEREYRVMTALRGSRVPVPHTHVLCTDSSVIGTPFYIMDYVEGRIFKDPALPGMSTDERFAIYSAMNEVLAELHKIDVNVVGLSDYGPTENYVQRQVDRWTKQYRAAETHTIEAMNNLQDYLRKNIPTGSDSRLVSLVHGDFRLDNLIFHPTQPRVIAVLDWELSTLGHPTADLAYTCIAYSFPQNPVHPGLAGANLMRLGIPSEKQFLQAYHRRVKRAGPIENYQYFLALSMFRLASIGQGVYKRSQQGNASSTTANLFGKQTELIAEIGWQVAQRATNSSDADDANMILEEKLAKMELLPFQFSAKFWELRKKLLAFMEDYVYPNEHLYHLQHQQAALTKGHPWNISPIVEDLKLKAKSIGLWNLFLTNSKHHSFGNGLTNLEYAPLCEMMGRSLWLAPEACNSAAPDTGNMEVLAMYGTPEQQEKWLKPLMAGEIRSCFGMTEPLVASSDATNIECRIRRDGDSYVINGRKWWASGAMDPRCKVCILMGQTDPDAPAHKRQSMILVPMDAPGLRIVRALHVFGYDDAPHGHAELELRDVRVPVSNMLLGEGRGFEIAQGRLGPGRIHHCMRLIGLSERALELMCRRVRTRSAFGSLIAEKGTIMSDIADSRIEIAQARLLTLQAASMMDTVGNKNARQEIAMIKVAAPLTALKVLDRAIQAYGAMGVSQDTELAGLWAQSRTLRLADGPDEVHKGTIAKLQLRRSRF